MQRLARTHVKGLQGRGGHSSQSWETGLQGRGGAEADTAAQSWETNVKDCKAEADTAVQSWETNVDTVRQM